MAQSAGRLRRLLGVSAAAVLLAAPAWAARIQTVNGRNLFLSPSSLVALGLSLLFAMACEVLLPDRVLAGVDKLLAWVRRRFKILAAVFLAFTLAGLMMANRQILHQFMNSADEHSCYFLAECLRLGRLWVPPHSLSEFFNVVHVGNRDGKWFSVYPPGWPLILALGLEWGIQDWLNPLMAVLALVFLFQAGKKIYGVTAAWTGIALTGLSPFFLFTSASYFSHAACLLAIAVFLFAFLKWQEHGPSGKGIAWAALAAFAAGYGLNTRYLTMAAVAAPFLIYRFWPVLMKREKWNRSHTVFAAVFVLMVLFVFLDNLLVTGKIFKAPNRYDKRWERLGFRGDYTILDGLIYFAARFFYLADWFPPMLIVLFFTALGKSFNQGQNVSPLKILFRWAFFYPAAAYFFYYSWGGNQYGPRYYFEGFPFLTLTLADGVKTGWRSGNRALQKFLLGSVVFSLVVSAFLFQKQARFFEAASRERKALYVQAEAEITKPAIVFIQGFLGDTLVLSEDDAVRNSPRLDAKILYAHDLGEKNRLLMNHYPERAYFRGRYDRLRKQAILDLLPPS